MHSYILENDDATVLFGKELAKCLEPNITIYLLGDLGAGKTTLTRGIVQGYGYEGIVKSPTFTLVEEYSFKNLMIYHFDLYRLNDPEELEFMGIRDYFKDNSIRLIEWPSKGEGIIDAPDLSINLKYFNNQRLIEIKANNSKCNLIVDKIEKNIATIFKKYDI
ncbi:MAG: tRNA (adenosine(37)-N6)-threonylcarbamoyltransferase complex ATPase subunit type 1 TsaE [Succinivibrionaceae bacterium]|nr:tRNA (adenosine(37)-N6)-threonylcarbamoyltransferase complex ATPase subunit type 1 TsaE [Ruminobacter sp.]MDY5779179.1 tRNA (adenosine(37)-N6)-threonylcarbamoyltransferase complex ATPase subunit type 1 TsaE [Succinivibrionaceae bacterium]MEE1340669.1 tRNA (adenosine(37)-N6)-threonylcarbamoyltransferase complex ATPase subunit type 1 TsaE [Succinivibrionaceae bacterium]